MTPQNLWMKAWKYRYVGILLIVLMFLLFGCSIPMERESTLNQKQLENNSGKTAAEIARASDIKPPDMKIRTTAKDGTTIDITQPVATSSTSNASMNSDEKATFKASGSWEWAESMPMAVRILIAAIGLGMLVAIFQYLRKNFVSVNTATKWADDLIDKAIHKVRSKTMETTDPHQIVSLTTMAGDMERDRTDFHKT